MDADPSEKAKAARVQRLLYVLTIAMIVVPLVIFLLRSFKRTS